MVLAMSETFRKMKRYLNQKLFLHSGRRRFSSTLTPCPLNHSDGSFSESSYSSSELVWTRLSSSSRFSGSLHEQVSKDACAICLVKMEIGQEAIFTSECCHSFHFNCIVTNVEHGNNFCPICLIKWNSVPFKAPTITHPLGPPPILAILAQTDDDLLAWLNRRSHSIISSSSLPSSLRRNPSPEPYIDDNELDELLLAACRRLSPPPAPTPSPS